MPDELLPISQLIGLAKEQNLYLGKGNPENRIRYFIKTGLLPHMQRRKNPATGKVEGHLPVSVLLTLKKVEDLKNQGYGAEAIRGWFATDKIRQEQTSQAPIQQLNGLVAKITEPLASTLEKVVQTQQTQNQEITETLRELATRPPSPTPIPAETRAYPRLAIAGIIAVIILFIASFFLISRMITEPLRNEIKSLALKLTMQPETTNNYYQTTNNYNNGGLPVDENGFLKLSGISIGDGNILLDSAGNIKFLGKVGGGLVDTETENLLLNPGFEVNQSGKPSFWDYALVASEGNTFVYQDLLDLGLTHVGQNSAKFNFNIGSPMSLGLAQERTKLTSGKTYTLSAWVKGDKLTDGTVRLGFGTLKTTGATNYQDYHLSGNFDWKRISYTFTATSDNFYPFFEARGYSGGALYLDDTALVEGTASTLFSTNPTSYLGNGSLTVLAGAYLYPTAGSDGGLGQDDKRFRNAYLVNADLSGTLTVDGLTTLNDNLGVSGAATVSGNVILGSNGEDTVTVNGGINSNLIPAAGSTYNLGSLNYSWASLYVDNIYGSGTGTQGYWQRNNQALAPVNITDDVLLGATATASALIKLTGTAGNNSWINTGNVGIGTTAPGYKLDVNGTGNFAGTISNTHNGLATTFLSLIDSQASGVSYYIDNGYPAVGIFGIRDSGGTRLAINAGNVGIGTTNPGSKLQVAGNITPEDTGTRDLGSSLLYWNNAYINNLYTGSSGTSGYWQRNAQALSPTNITDDILTGATSTASALIKLTGTSGNNSWFNTGNVGIGTTSPGAKLNSFSTTEQLRLSYDGSNYSSFTVLSNGALAITAAAGSNNVIRFQSIGQIYAGDNSKNYYFQMQNSSNATTVQISTSGSSFFNGGNVGIGTTSPGAKLDVYGTNTVTGSLGNLFIHTSNAQSINLGGQITLGGSYTDASDQVGFGVVAGRKETSNTGNAAGYLSFATTNEAGGTITEKVRISSTGNVGIGTTAPTAKLEIGSGGANPYFYIYGNRTSVGDKYGNMQVDTYGNFILTAQQHLRLRSASGYVVSLGTTDDLNVVSGNVGIGTATPSEKLDVVGNATASGNLTLYGGARTIQTTAMNSLTIGGLTTGNITLNPLNAAAGGYVAPAVTSVSDLGTSSLYWNNAYINNLYTGSSGISGYWQRNAQALSPTNITDDILLGATATASALIKLTGTSGNNSWINTGNVGIGTTTPTLNANFTGMEISAAGAGLALTSTNAGGKRFIIGSTTGGVGLYIRDETAGAYRMHIDTNGNVGIGTVAPGLKLDVQDTSNPVGIRAKSTNSDAYLALDKAGTNNYAAVRLDSGGSAKWDFGMVSDLNFQLRDRATGGNPTRFLVDTGGNVGIGTTAPGAKLQIGNNTSGSGVLPTNSTLWMTSIGAASPTVPVARLDISMTAFNPDYSTYLGTINVDYGTTPAIGVIGTRNSTVDYPAVYLRQGNVGIGTTAPLAKLDVSGNATVSGNLTFYGGRTIQTTAMTPLTIGGDTTGNITLNPVNAQSGGYVAPAANGVSDLGTSALRWNNIYANTLQVYTSMSLDGDLEMNNHNILHTDKIYFGSANPNGNVYMWYNNVGGYLESSNDINTSGFLRSGGYIRMDSTGNMTNIGSISMTGSLTTPTSITSSGNVQGSIFTSTVGGGTAPLSVISTTKVANLNVDLLDGYDWSAVGTNILPDTTGTKDLGSSSKIWNNLYANNVLAGGITGTQGWWQRNGQALSPTNITDDILTGATATASALIKLTGTSGNNSWINTGNVGIGTTNPGSKLSISTGNTTGTTGSIDTSTTFTNQAAGSYYDNTHTTTIGLSGNQAGNSDFYGVQSTVQTAADTNTYGASSALRSFSLVTKHQGSQTFPDMRGLWLDQQNTGAGTLTNAKGIDQLIRNTGAGTISNVYGLSLRNPTNSGGGTISNFYGVYVPDITTVSTNVRGLDLNVASGANKFNIYAGGTAANYFTGNVGIGTTNPSAPLSVGSTSQFQVNSSGAIAAATGISSSGNIDFSSLNAGGMVKAAVTSGRLSIATGGTDYEYPLTFNNGLTRATNVVKLGGTLTAATEIPLGGFNLSFSGTGNVGIGTTAPAYNLDISGTLRTTSTTTFNTLTYTWPSSLTNNFILQTNSSGTLSWVDPSLAGASTIYWTQGAGILYPKNATVDTLIGGTATDSAKFAFINVNSGTPTASISAGLNGAAYLTATGTLATTAKQNLTIGSTDTGNITIDSGINTILGDATIQLSGTNPTISATATNSTLGLAANGSGTLTLNAGATGNIQFFSSSNTLSSGGNLTIAGTTTFNSRTYTWPGSEGTNYVLSTSGSGILSWSEPGALVGGTNLWNQTDGLLSPKNSTVDVSIGGTATTSAKFMFMNVNSGNPTASISGNLSMIAPTGANPATSYNALNGGTINLRTSVGGDAGLVSRLFITNAGSVGIGVTNPAALFSVGSASEFQVNSSGSITSTGDGAGLTFSGPNNHTISASSGTLLLGAVTLTGAVTGGNQNITNIGNISANSSGNTITSFGTIGTLSVTDFTGSTLTANSTANAITLSGSGATIAFTGTTGVNQITTASSRNLALMPSGNVGIGTTNPAAKLEVVGGSAVPLRVDGSGQANSSILVVPSNVGNGIGFTGSAVLQWTNSSNAIGYIRATDAAGYLRFDTGGSNERVRIDSSGNVGIGMTAPTVKLDVNGAASVSGNLTLAGGARTIAGTAMNALTLGDANTGNIQFFNSTNYITSTGALTLASTASLGGNLSMNNNNINNIGNAYFGSGNNVSLAYSATYGLLAGNAGMNLQGSLYTGGFERLDTSGNLVLIGSITMTGTLTTPSSITSSGNIQGTIFTSTVTTGTAPLSISSQTKVSNLNVDLLDGYDWSSVGTHIIPDTTGSKDLGSSSKYWANLYVNNIYAPASGTQGYWQRNTNALSPTNISDDILTGATATASALIKLTGTSGNDSWINTGNVGIGTTAPGSILNIVKAQNTSTVVKITNTSTGTSASAGFYAINDSTQGLVLRAQSSSFTISGLRIANYGTIVSEALLDGLVIGTEGAGDPLVFGTFANQRMRIDGNGNVGIGTTAPAAQLDVNGSIYSTATAIKMGYNSAISLNAVDFWGDGAISTSNNGNLYLTPNGTGNVLVNNGNVGIGTTSPISKLHVSGAVTGKALAIFDETGDQAILTASASGATKFIVDHAGNVGIGTSAPGYTLDVNGAVNIASTNNLRFNSGNMLIYHDGGNGVIDTNAAGGDVVIRPESGGSLRPYVDNSFALGTTSFRWNSLAVGMADSSFAGKVGIGTTAPGEKLQVSDGTYSIKLVPGSPNAIRSDDWGVDFKLTTTQAGGTANSSQLYLQSTGNVGIGTTAPGGKLEVRQDTGTIGIKITSPTSTTATALEINQGASSSNLLTDWKNSGGTSMLAVLSNGKIRGYNGNHTLDLGETAVGDIYLNLSGNNGAIYMPLNYASTYLNVGPNNTFVVKGAEAGTGAVGIGTVAPAGKLHVTNSGVAPVGKALVTFDQYENQDIFTASSSGTPKFVITNTGNVGIGTTAPTALLDVAGTASVSALTIRGASPGYIDQLNGNDLRFRTSVGGDGGLADRMILTNAGNVGIGTTAPSVLLHLGTGGTKAGYIRLESASGVNQTGDIAVTNGKLTLATYVGGYPIQLTGSEIFLGATGNPVNVGIGTTAPISTLHVTGATTGKALAIFDETGDQALFTASASGVSKFTIDHSGNVGIGTTAPGTKLQVAGGNIILDRGQAFQFLDSVGTARNSLYYSTGDVLQLTNNNNALGGAITFNTKAAAAESMRIDSSGNVGIGTTAPAAKLQLLADVQQTGGDTAQLMVSGATNQLNRLLLGYDTTANVGFIGAVTHGTAWRNLSLAALGGNVGVGTTAPVTLFEISKNQNTETKMQVSNANAGVAAFGSINLYNGTSYASFNLFGTGFTSSGTAIQNSARLWTDAAQGLSIASSNASGVIRFYAGGATTDNMTINASGNVGIGTTAPSDKLQVEQGNIRINAATSTAGYLKLYKAGTQVGYLASGGSDNNVWLQATNAAGDLRFQTGGSATERMTITSGGNVGIGTTAPTTPIDIKGPGTGAQFTIEDSTNGTAAQMYLNSSLLSTTPNLNIGFAAGDGANRAVNFRLNGANVMTVSGSGRVGIGVTNPGNLLSIYDGLNTAFLQPSGVGTDRSLYYIVTSYNGTAYMYMQFNADNKFRFQSDGAAYAENGPWTTGAVDLAENYVNEEPMDAGDIVVISDQTDKNVKKTSYAYQGNLIGAVSTKPGFLLGGAKKLNDDEKMQEVIFIEGTKPIALIGRAPVKVSSLGGPITKGDSITSSSLKGIGMKATKAGMTIGKAFEDFSPLDTSCPAVASLESISWPADDDGENSAKPCYRLPDGTYVGKIMTYISTSLHDPDVYLTSTGDLQIINTGNFVYDGTQGRSLATFELRDTAGQLIQRAAAFSEAAIANLRVGAVSASRIVTDALQATQINTDKIVSPLAEINTLNVGIISPLADRQDVIVKLPSQESRFGKLLVQNDQGETVASVDAGGNASFSGQVTGDRLQVTRDATVSGTLFADEIVTKHGKFGDLLANQLTAATISAQYVANAIPSIQQLNNSTIKQLSWENWSVSDVENDIKITSDIKIIGHTSLASTTIAGGLSVDAALILDENGLQTFDPASILRLQFSGLGGVDFLAGKVTIDKDGNMNIEGNLAVKGTLTTARLAAADMEATGSAKFADLLVSKKLTVATASATVSQSASEQITDSSIGKATIMAGQQTITIRTPQVTGASQVFVTPTSPTGNKVLYVTNQSDGQFRVEIDSPIDRDIQFNWWLVN